jgi:hypothetical protein
VQTIKWDDRLRRGDTFRMGFRPAHLDLSTEPPTKVYDYNFTGHTGKAQLRRSADSPTVLLEFTVSIPDQSLTPGMVWVTATAAQTAALTEDSGVYDVQLTSGTGDVFTIAGGNIYIDPDVTRS